MLGGALERGRLASSYLFAGEEGVGKRSAAEAFAMALNCVSPEKGRGGISDAGVLDACGKCGSCVKIAQRTHPDFVMVEPESGVIKVEEVRRIEEMLSFRAFEAKYKTVIMDQADAMNISAANAFLKTLEEPAPMSLIILVSSTPERLPITIRSRCSRINFHPLSPEDMAAVLGADADEALLNLAQGRPGLATGDDLLSRRERFLQMLRQMLESADKAAWKDRQEIEAWLDMCLLFLRDMAVFKSSGNDRGLINSDIPSEIRQMCGRATLEGIIKCYGNIRKLRSETLFNLNKSITWNYTASQLAALGVYE